MKEAAGALEISVDVKNDGEAAGRETVQLYMQDVAASLVRPVKELKGFEKVALNPGEKKTVHFTLAKQDMGFYDNDRNYLLEDGLFRIYAGGNSREVLMQEVQVSFA